jgi:segregation and condensation protein B
MTLDQQIEAILFWKGEPMSTKELAAFLDVEKSLVEAEVAKLQENLKAANRGIALVKNGDEVMLYTAPEASELIKKLTKEELSREVSKAGVEVLSLILYRGPISRRDIDYIRGVNSSYIIRNLSVRGLIEKTETKDGRSTIYRPTFELLAHLGVSKVEDLPDFAQVQKDIESFMTQESNQEASGAASEESHGV